MAAPGLAWPPASGTRQRYLSHGGKSSRCTIKISSPRGRLSIHDPIPPFAGTSSQARTFHNSLEFFPELLQFLECLGIFSCFRNFPGTSAVFVSSTDYFIKFDDFELNPGVFGNYFLEILGRSEFFPESRQIANNCGSPGIFGKIK